MSTDWPFVILPPFCADCFAVDDHLAVMKRLEIVFSMESHIVNGTVQLS